MISGHTGLVHNKNFSPDAKNILFILFPHLTYLNIVRRRRRLRRYLGKWRQNLNLNLSLAEKGSCNFFRKLPARLFHSVTSSSFSFLLLFLLLFPLFFILYRFYRHLSHSLIQILLRDFIFSTQHKFTRGPL